MPMIPRQNSQRLRYGSKKVYVPNSNKGLAWSPDITVLMGGKQ